jgi:hypothetical protein
VRKKGESENGRKGGKDGSGGRVGKDLAYFNVTRALGFVSDNAIALIQITQKIILIFP